LDYFSTVYTQPAFVAYHAKFILGARTRATGWPSALCPRLPKNFAIPSHLKKMRPRNATCDNKSTVLGIRRDVVIAIFVELSTRGGRRTILLELS
jgi:hypothetical protein